MMDAGSRLLTGEEWQRKGTAQETTPFSKTPFLNTAYPSDFQPNTFTRIH
jgi:hypothetical protein